MTATPQRRTVYSGSAALLIFVLLTLIYGHTIVGRAEHTGFAWVDDRVALAENPHLQEAWDVQGLKSLVTRPYFYDWTPVYWAIMWLERGLMGNHAAGYRTISLLAFGLSLFVLFQLLQKWTDRPGLSLFLIGLLAAHPMMIESLTWPTTQKTVLSLLIAVTALWAYDRSLEVDRGLKYRFLVFLLCVVGLGIKLRSLALPVCLLAYDLAHGLTQGRSVRRCVLPALRRTGPLILVAGAWALYNQFGVFSRSAATGQYEAYLGGSVAASLASHAVIELRTLGHWLRPDPVYYHHDFSIYRPSQWQPWASGLGCIAILGLLIRAAPRDRRMLAWFGAAWYVIQRGLTAGILPNQWGTMHNRYSTVPSVGLLILIGLALAGLMARPRWRDVHRAQVWLEMTIVLAFAAFSHVHATALLMEGGRVTVSHPRNVYVQLRHLLQSSGESLDENWERLRRDPRAGATIGKIGLAHAAVHWASDRVRRDLPAPDAIVAEYCRELPSPHAELYRASYYHAAGRPDQLWAEVTAARATVPVQTWLREVDADLRAARERDWRSAYLRIGDGSARFQEADAWSRVLWAAYDAAPDPAGRVAITTLARGLAPEVKAWKARYAELTTMYDDPDS